MKRKEFEKKNKTKEVCRKKKKINNNNNNECTRMANNKMHQKLCTVGDS